MKTSVYVISAFVLISVIAICAAAYCLIKDKDSAKTPTNDVEESSSEDVSPSPPPVTGGGTTENDTNSQMGSSNEEQKNITPENASNDNEIANAAETPDGSKILADNKVIDGVTVTQNDSENVNSAKNMSENTENSPKDAFIANALAAGILTCSGLQDCEIEKNVVEEIMKLDSEIAKRCDNTNTGIEKSGEESPGINSFNDDAAVLNSIKFLITRSILNAIKENGQSLGNLDSLTIRNLLYGIINEHGTVDVSVNVEANKGVSNVNAEEKRMPQDDDRTMQTPVTSGNEFEMLSSLSGKSSLNTSFEEANLDSSDNGLKKKTVGEEIEGTFKRHEVNDAIINRLQDHPRLSSDAKEELEKFKTNDQRGEVDGETVKSPMKNKALLTDRPLVQGENESLKPSNPPKEKNSRAKAVKFPETFPGNIKVNPTEVSETIENILDKVEKPITGTPNPVVIPTPSSGKTLAAVASEESEEIAESSEVEKKIKQEVANEAQERESILVNNTAKENLSQAPS